MTDNPHLLAIVSLAGLAVGLLAWAHRAWRRTPFNLTQAALYFVNLLLTRWLWRTRVVGRLQLPATVGAVIVSNHRCSVDPLFMQLTTKRIVHWLVAREYCEHPLLAWLFRATQSIPVNRGGIDTAATKQSLRIVQDGGLVGMFPEGRINTSSQFLLPGRPGAILVALKGRVPVIPCYIQGAPMGKSVYSPLLAPARVTVFVGQPIDLSPYYGRERDDGVLDELTVQVLQAVARLGGGTDFMPRIAGRRWKTGEPVTTG